MDKSRSTFTSHSSNVNDQKKKIPEETSKKAKGDCFTPASTSHTQYFRKTKDKVFERITTDEYVGLSESITGSSDTFQCVHGPEGKKYSQKGLLKRNLIKELDPIKRDKKWNDKCPPAYGWNIAKTLEFLVNDPIGVQQTERLEAHLRDFAKIAKKGYKIDTLDSLCTVLDYLVENLQKMPSYRDGLQLLLKNLDKPILLNLNSDVITYFDSLREYLGYLGYLLMRLEDDDLFDLVSKGLIYQLTAPDSLRGHEATQLRHNLAAAKTVLAITATRMIALATTHRFPTYLEIAFILACDSVDNCLDMFAENIFENIFYRFNPYFPDRPLPAYDINPSNLDDYCVKLGGASLHMSITLSLLLVLVKTLKKYIEDNPGYEKTLPCPDEYAQRCFIWAYRYECRARQHHHQRSTLTVIANVLLYIFRDNLLAFSSILMHDVMTLAVSTELPPRDDWTRSVNFDISQHDVQFKKMLIYLSVDFLKIYPFNKFMADSCHWFVGLMYLVDPGLCQLRTKWTTVLFAELRKTALQALMLSLNLIPSDLPTQYSLIRRTMWYIEWYSESPYELAVLYWCVRLLQMSLYDRRSTNRKSAIRELLQSHGIVVLMHLSYTLIQKKTPPVEKSQSIIGLNLRLLTSAVEAKARVTCCVYPTLKWPGSINTLVKTMMDVVLYSLGKHFIVSDRWLISLLSFLWQAVIWKTEYRQIFLANNGIYQLLDVITMTRYPVQCIALSLVCDIARAGDAVGQLVTWRANFEASNANPITVQRGSTITTLLAALFKKDCIAEKIALDENNVLQDLDYPLMSAEVKKYYNNPDFAEGGSQRTPVCLAAADLSGSRMSKCYAILQMLSEDLEYKVSLADEAYNLYKNVQMKLEDEVILVLCSHFLTVKLHEAWLEAQIQSPGYVAEDECILEEFIHIGKGWAENIQRQQLDIIERYKKKEYDHECTLHAFLGRVRLNIALDALREVRCVARSADRVRIAHTLIYEAVHAFHRRSTVSNKIAAPVIQTYGPTLDDQNIIGQNVKVCSIKPKKYTSVDTHQKETSNASQ